MGLKSFILIVSFLASGCGNHTSIQPSSNSAPFEYAININTASLDELQRIPHVGDKVAERIIEHREINGPFRRVEHLMLIQGISDKRVRKIRSLVRVE